MSIPAWKEEDSQHNAQYRLFTNILILLKKYLMLRCPLISKIICFQSNIYGKHVIKVLKTSFWFVCFSPIFPSFLFWSLCMGPGKRDENLSFEGLKSFIFVPLTLPLLFPPSSPLSLTVGQRYPGWRGGWEGEREDTRLALEHAILLSTYSLFAQPLLALTMFLKVQNCFPLGAPWATYLWG